MYSDLHHDSYQRLHDAAKLQADALRHQAIEAFRRRLGHAVRAGLQALRHPARRQLTRGA
ncbi:MAG: hypothetical protein PSV26_02450 [Polaromonas sp.]|uniref:hypothetical protein n=1 Tax=Polaromonas sp. TaxID=1869339 RepID=UPI002489434E|nr:hypothetical protein [Polaromonas sp.]MDI1236326.1 hypothetical protein [Polaromonas sp.]MDI1342030.1 hypothetical protein [Polaromonas sp.]